MAARNDSKAALALRAEPLALARRVELSQPAPRATLGMAYNGGNRPTAA
jgi:hypothetical protein